MENAARAARPQTTNATTPAPSAPPARSAAPPVRAGATAAPPAVRLQEGGAKRGVGPDGGKKLVQAAGPGEPLPEAVRGALEKSLGADLSRVRVHRGPRSAEAVDALSARAVTYGANVFLGPRERPTDLALMAHEVAHVVQQQGAPKIQKFDAGGAGDSYEAEAHRASAAVVRGERYEVSGRTSGARAQRWGMDTILNKIAGWANAIPGFRMFTVVLGVNPVNMSPVERSPANVMRAVVEFIPGGNLITRALDTYGVFDKVGAWVSQQLASLGMAGSAIKAALMAFLKTLGPGDFLDPGGVWERAKSIFTDPIDRIKSFVSGFITGILDFLRDAIMKPLAALASKTDGYDLLKAVLGKDPITGEAVPQTADALIGGFMKLIGQTEVWENIKKGNAVARAFAWFKGTLSGALAFVRQVPALIITTLKSIVLEDLLPLTNLFGKVGRAFGGFVGSFFSWAGGQVLKLLEIIFEVVAPAAVPYIKKAAGAFKSIVSNPVGFVGNLVRAGMQGFRQFAGNFLSHLRKSLVDWLTGTMSGAGIYVPRSFTLREIVMFALSVLGLTWANIRQKLVKAVGETTVKAMEAGFDIVVTLVTQGPGAAWEKIKEGVSNLQSMVMEQVMSFVKQKVVEQAVTKLLSMLSPAGAFIQAIIATYNTIMFFVERLRQIAQVAASFIDSIAAIASGNVGSAAKRVETTMAGLLTLVISFLARIAGLGKVSNEVIKIVNRVRAPIDKALDRVIDWIVATARRLGRFVAQAGVPQDPAQRLRLAGQAAVAAGRRLGGRITQGLLAPVLAGIKVRYGLTDIAAFERGGKWFARITINPQIVPEIADTSGDDAERAIKALIGKPVVTPGQGGGAASRLIPDPVGYLIHIGRAGEEPSIQRARRPSGGKQLPLVYIDAGGLLREGSKPTAQNRSSEVDLYKKYQALAAKLGYADAVPALKDAEVTPAKNKSIRGALRGRILGDPKYATLEEINKFMADQENLTGPGMQGELFEAWIVKYFGSATGIQDSKATYNVPAGKGTMDRYTGSDIVEIKSRTRPDVPAAVADDDIPKTKFALAGNDRGEFTKYAQLLAGQDIPEGKKVAYKKAGKKPVAVGPFTGTIYYFNYLGAQKKFFDEMPGPLKGLTRWYVGGRPV